MNQITLKTLIFYPNLNNNTSYVPNLPLITYPEAIRNLSELKYDSDIHSEFLNFLESNIH